MESLNNPAARLHALLQAAKSNAQLRHQGSMKSWATLLLVPDGNQALVLRRLGSVMELPMLIKERISNLQGIDNALYLRWLPKVEGAFRANHLGGSFSGFVEAYDEATLLGIEHCGSILARKDPDLEVTLSDLDSISKQVDELLTETRDTAVDAEVRLFILKHLYSIRKAIDEYQLFGAKPLSTAMGEAIGACFTEREKANKVSNTPQGHQFWEFITRIGLVLSVTDKAGRLTDRLVKLLGCGGE